MLEKVLVAVDGSEANLPAVDFAARLSKEEGAKLVLVNVVQPAAVLRGTGYQESEAAELLSRIRGRIQAEGGDVVGDQVVLAGVSGPAEAIADAARAETADLIITGNRGHGAWTGAMLGSVSQRLLHSAPCPVLVVPGE